MSFKDIVKMYEDDIKEYASIKRITEEEARKELRELIKEFYGKEEIEDIEEMIEDRFQSYLSVGVDDIDIYDRTIKASILTSFGGPTTWIPLKITKDFVEIDRETLDYEYEWFKQAHGKIVKVRDLIDIIDVITISRNEDTIREIVISKIKEFLEDFSS